MTAKELIEKYELFEQNGMVGIPNMYMTGSNKESLLAEIKARKPEILEELRKKEEEARAAAAERQAKIDAIEGLKEIDDLRDAWAEYHRKFDEMMDDEYNDGVNPPTPPKQKPEDLMDQYPRAAAYIKARSYAGAANFRKHAAGKKSVDRIINGEDYNKAISDMESEWTAHVRSHAWD